jgi:prepilin-type N-terminal cleavage/methylation domain-containing protein
MRQRGLTLIEVLVALLLLAAGLSGLMGLWTFGFNVTRHSQDLGVGYNIARQEIERAKNIGFLLLPEATWTRGYDGLGNVAASPSPHFTATATVQTIPDANGQLNTSCLRTLHVRVNAREGNEVVFESTTYLTWGGI